MTERIDAIKSRLAAASPGPWEWCNDAKHSHEDDTLCVVGAVEAKRYEAIDVDYIEHREVVGCSEWMRAEQPDKDFIAHAREDIPYLLDLIERLTQQVEECSK